MEDLTKGENDVRRRLLDILLRLGGLGVFVDIKMVLDSYSFFDE